ncbi:MAG: hypothetical protein M0R17_01555 [Candidatus Omnitrophica bacterium]|jgi:hypothetical protein|nr:hypothetical protein [Candidatus Omnitrophota bacterium]
MFIGYSSDIGDVLDKEVPEGKEQEFIPAQQPIQQPVQKSINDYDANTYQNPKSVKMWRHIIQYFLNQIIEKPLVENNWDAAEADDNIIFEVIKSISKEYNISSSIIYNKLYYLIDEEVEKFLWDENWKPEYAEGKYIDRSPSQPKRMPQTQINKNYKNWYNTPYEPIYDTINEQEATDWLIKYYNNTSFSINTIVGFLEDYVFKYKRFGKSNDEILNTFVKSLPEKKPEQFQLMGSKLHIGVVNTNLEFNQAEPQVEINHEELKNIALSNIEDFKKYGDVTETKDGIYIFIDRGSSILAVAHLDTVQSSQHYYTLQHDEEELIHNAQLDDRLGAYIILNVLPKLGVNADILLTEGEETGKSTARHFVPTKAYNWVFEFDRAGTDAVLYQYDDEATRKLLEEQGIHVGKGSFSDTAVLDHLGVKAINFGTGAYDSHNEESHAVVPQVQHCVSKFVKFYNAMKDTTLPHKAKENYFRK